MTTGRPRLESSPAGQRAIDYVRVALCLRRDISLSELAYQLRKSGVERPTGGLDWNEKAVKRVLDRAKELNSLDSRPAPR